jgi:hypothetical protein
MQDSRRNRVSRTEQLYARFCRSVSECDSSDTAASTAVVPRPIWLLGSAVRWERTYNVDLLLCFVLGVVLNLGVAQMMQS